MSKAADPESKKSKRRRHPDIELASIAVKTGYVTKDAAKLALKEVKTRAKKGKPRISFLRILLNKDLLDAKKLPALAQEMERHTYICDHCDRRCVFAPSKSRQYSCPRCGSPIEAAYSDNSIRNIFETGRETADVSEPLGLTRVLTQKKVAFGRYKVLEELGRGAMGVVYRALHVELKKSVALKVLLAGVGARSSHVTRFRREAAAVARLSHPNIVRVFDFGSEDNMHFLSMELVEGGHSLHLALKNEGELDLKHRIEIIEKVALAMQHAHDEGIVHRDLKPANILIDPEGQPLVADFGLAKDFEEEDELTQPEARVGTPLFLAPELIHKGAQAVDQRADIWSLGVMIFLSVTGHYPYRAKTVMELYVQVLQDVPDWNGTRASKLASSQSEQATKKLRQPFIPGAANFPKDLRLICEHALTKNPDHRYQTAAELGADLGRYLRGEPVHVRQASIFERLRLFTKRRKSAVIIGLGAFLFLVSLLVLLMANLTVNSQTAQDNKVRIETAERAWAPAETGDFAYTKEGYEKARLRLDSALSLQADHALTLYYRGLTRLHLFQEEQAEQDFRAAYKLALPDLKARISLAMAQLRLYQGRTDEALSATQPLPKDEALVTERAILRARIYLARNTTSDLDKGILELSKLSSPSARAHLMTGTFYWLKGSFDKAISEFETALKGSKELKEAAIARDVVLIHKKSKELKSILGRLGKNQKELLKSIDPLARYYYQEGLALEKTNRLSALQAYKRANLISFWFAAARAGQARLLEETGRVEEAIPLMHEATRIDPTSRKIKSDRKNLLRLACDPSTLKYAVRAYKEEALWRGKDAYSYLVDLGIAQFSLSKLGEAEKALMKVKKRSPLALLFLYELAVETKHPDLEKFKSWWEKARDKDLGKRPDSVKRHYNILTRAQLLRGNLDRASDALKLSIEIESESRYGKTLIGQAFANRAAIAAARGLDQTLFADLTKAVEQGGISSYELDRLPAFLTYRKHPNFVTLRNSLIKSEQSPGKK
ncbi:MAG: protein kinase [Planctomycetota bacterium]|nr:protein kinase [Planctomycetota bacterium]